MDAWQRLMWNIIWKGKDNMLNTNLTHLEIEEEVREVLENNEKVVAAASSIQTKEQITEILDKEFGKSS